MGGNLTHSMFTKKLLQELIPEFVLPYGLNFITKVYLNLAKILLLIGNGIVPMGHKAQDR